MIIVQMIGVFSQLENEWRSERQMTGIRKAQENGVHKQTQETIELIEKHPPMKNIELAKIGGVHFNTITKVRKMIGIQKMDKKQG